MNPVLDRFRLAGHDSELFSFILEEEREQLEKHRGASVLLWTFAYARDGMLESVPMWNVPPGCFAWRRRPPIIQAEGECWASYRSLVSDQPLCQVPALMLVRAIFGGVYRCALDDADWITEPADRELRRLRFIRGDRGYTTMSPEWKALRKSFVQWCIDALDIVAAGDEIEF
jgi:hypothetical protein